MVKSKDQRRGRRLEDSLYLASEIPKVTHLKRSRAGGRGKAAKPVEENNQIEPGLKLVKEEQINEVMGADQVQQLAELFCRLIDDFQKLQDKTGEFQELVHRVRKTLGDFESQEVSAVAVVDNTLAEQHKAIETESNFLDVVEGMLQLVTTPGIGPMLGQLVSALGK